MGTVLIFWFLSETVVFLIVFPMFPEGPRRGESLGVKGMMEELLNGPAGVSSV